MSWQFETTNIKRSCYKYNKSVCCIIIISILIRYSQFYLNSLSSSFIIYKDYEKQTHSLKTKESSKKLFVDDENVLYIINSLIFSKKEMYISNIQPV